MIPRAFEDLPQMESTQMRFYHSKTINFSIIRAFFKLRKIISMNSWELSCF